jgi:hypothetical protein
MPGYSRSTEHEELMKTPAPSYNPGPAMVKARGPTRLVRLAPVALAVAAAAAFAAAETSRTFDADPAGRPPAGFTFHVVRHQAPPHWLVEREQANGFLAHRGETAGQAGFALALVEADGQSDLSVSARVRLAGGQRSGGLVWRVQDPENYYLARLDLDRQDIGLYRVTAGNRTRIDGEDDLELDATAWHTLRVVQEEENIRVYLGGIRVLRARDRTFSTGGRAGLWCAGDAVAHFDDLRLGTREDKGNDADPRRGR